MDVYGLIGNPVGHSLSPPMHEAGYGTLGIDALRDVRAGPDDDAVAAIGGRCARGRRAQRHGPVQAGRVGRGGSRALAERIGAVNTVDFGPLRAGDADRPRGHNTDAAGVKRAFLITISNSRDGTRSSSERAARAGRRVRAGRRGRDGPRREPHRGAGGRPGRRRGPRRDRRGLDDLGDRIAGADVLVNATSVGMDEPEATPVPADHLHGDLAVLDAVYAPIDATPAGGGRRGRDDDRRGVDATVPRGRGVRNLDRRRRAGGGDERGAAGRVGVRR